MHWLDYSEEKYGKKLVMETRIAIKVVLMSLPVPIFWACLMQQRSRWIFQATKMDGNLGWYTIKPDQMIVINSLMAVLLVPFLDKFIYPVLAKVGIKTTLQRLIFGGVLIIIAFVFSVIVETQVQKKTISILWQLPQFFTIAVAEIFTYLSHLNFAYKEAPPSMKPVMMSLLYLSMAGGDLIVAIISGISIFPSQAFEFAFYACLVLLDVIVLAILAHSYQPVDHEALRSLDNVNVNKDDK
jgi:dipeptide/tripeptide permease